jgi:hypothetical protein
LDIDPIVDRVDVNAIVDKVDVNAIVAKVDVDSIVNRLDLDSIVDRLDLDSIVARVDMDAIVQRLDVAALARYVVTEIDLPEIIRESSTSVATETVQDVRIRSMQADELVSRIVGRAVQLWRVTPGRDGSPDDGVSESPGDESLPHRALDGDVRPRQDHSGRA